MISDFRSDAPLRVGGIKLIVRFARLLDVRRHILYPLCGPLVLGGWGPRLIPLGQGVDWDILRERLGLDGVDSECEVMTKSAANVSP